MNKLCKWIQSFMALISLDRDLEDIVSNEQPSIVRTYIYIFSTFDIALLVQELQNHL